MAFLDSLKEFVRVNLNINIQVGVKTVNITADPGADVVSFDETNGALKINWKKLPEDKIEELKPVIADAVREHNALLIETGSKEILEEIKTTESSNEEREFLSFFKGKIPDDDYTALRASLYVKRRFEEGAQKEEINRLKSDILRRYSKRGRNICDLCSAGYFKGLIKIYGSHPKSFQRLTIPIVQSILSPPREKLSGLWRQTSDTAPLWVSPRGGGIGRGMPPPG